MKKYFAIGLTLVLFGAGCAAAEKPVKPEMKPEAAPVVENKVKTPKQDSSTTPQNEDVAKAPTEIRELVAAKTDDTWKTYTSKSLGFSFDWPTKGRYAPTWEVKVYGTSDAKIKGECYEFEGGDLSQIPAYPTSTSVQVDDHIFCKSEYQESIIGASTFYDVYTTKIGTQMVAIGFTKMAYNPNATRPDDSGPSCGKEGLSSVANSCAPFEKSLYKEFLDSIIGTFRLTE